MGRRSGGRRPVASALQGRIMTALAVVLTVCVALPASAQSGLTFVGGVGYEEGGPGPSLVESLAAAGLADVKEGRCFLTTCIADVEHPFYYNEGLNMTAFIGGRYRFNAPISIELLFSNGQRGHAEGFSDETNQTLVVAYASFMATTTAGLHLGPFRLEAGPILNQIFWDVTRDSRTLSEESTSVMGLLFGASGSVRVSDVYLSLRAGVRRFPTVDLTHLRVPLEARYRSFYVGFTVLPVLH